MQQRIVGNDIKKRGETGEIPPAVELFRLMLAEAPPEWGEADRREKEREEM